MSFEQAQRVLEKPLDNRLLFQLQQLPGSFVQQAKTVLHTSMFAGKHTTEHISYMQNGDE